MTTNTGEFTITGGVVPTGLEIGAGGTSLELVTFGLRVVLDGLDFLLVRTAVVLTDDGVFLVDNGVMLLATVGLVSIGVCSVLAEIDVVLIA